eukprot:TRINITY_DN6548_c0_g1_i3.p1 TRINITY_DN6548_c0_g1~~TRINITY_DN6548_c0_g1_i3.p1  ORF type:complete len:141 (-),score=16.23 TRINITY_DN6548_c0_g1_i3:307-729(-)
MRKYGPSFHSKLPRTEENKMETAEHIGPGSYEVDVQPRPRYVHTQDWVFRSTIPRASPKRISAAVTTEPVYYSVADDERVCLHIVSLFMFRPIFRGFQNRDANADCSPASNLVVDRQEGCHVSLSNQRELVDGELFICFL